MKSKSRVEFTYNMRRDLINLCLKKMKMKKILARISFYSVETPLKRVD